jgi:hypothetical protein
VAVGAGVAGAAGAAAWARAGVLAIPNSATSAAASA